MSECPEQLFNFDEVERMPEGVLDVLKPIIDYNDNVDEVDYRKVIFIFLSNTGQSAINEEMLMLWYLREHRNDIKYSDFKKLISESAFNEKGIKLILNLKHFLMAFVYRRILSFRYN